MGRPVSTGSKPGAQMATAWCPGQRPPAPDPGGRGVPSPVINTKAERRAARERVSAYHQEQLAELLSRVAAAIDRYRDGETGACTVDEMIHHYHLAATQLWKFCFACGGGTHAEFIAGILNPMTADAETIDWWERATPRRHQYSRPCGALQLGELLACE